MAKILLVEDDVDLANSLRRYLQSNYYTVDHTCTAEEGDYLVRHYFYEVIILDWELPDGSGADLCTRWREANIRVPVLMLTGRSTVPDKVQGLDRGADDYLSKPFDQEELQARLRALLKRRPSTAEPQITVGDLKLDLNARRAIANGIELKITPRDFDVLALLTQNAREHLSTEQILKRVWGDLENTQPTAVFSAIKRLRKAIAEVKSGISIEHAANAGYGLFESSKKTAETR